MADVARAPEPSRQRFRVVYARGDAAASLAQRDEIEAWERALAGSGLPLALIEGARPRPRLAFGAPLPVGMLAERELLDLFLVRMLPVADVRAALAEAAPAGHEIVDVYDVWTGAPALAGLVAAADYRLECALPAGADPTAVAAAAERLLAAPTLVRERTRGEKRIRYDLRPFLLDLAAEPAIVGAVVRVRLRIDPELGTGRPEEVLAALSGVLGLPLVAERRARERLWLVDELPSAPGLV